MCISFRYPIFHVDHHATFSCSTTGLIFFCPSGSVESSWTSRSSSKAAANPIEAHSARRSPDVYTTPPPGLIVGDFPSAEISSRVELRCGARAQSDGNLRPSIAPTNHLLRNSGTLHSAEPTARSEATKNMVYSATENVKKRLGSCEKVTMKLRSLLNISNISSTCASHKRLEESSQVKDREFRLVTWDESSQVLMESITSTTISCINSIFDYDVDIKSNM